MVGQIEDENYANDIKRVIDEHNLRGHVRTLEHINDLSTLRAEHNIGLTCSKREAFGRVTIENMMSGMLVIGADSGGTAEIIRDGNNGFLYRTDDPDDLERCVKYIINNPSEARVIALSGKKDAID